MKNCDRGLANVARGRRPRAAFSSPRSQFFTIRTDPKTIKYPYNEYLQTIITMRIQLRRVRREDGCEMPDLHKTKE